MSELSWFFTLTSFVLHTSLFTIHRVVEEMTDYPDFSICLAPYTNHTTTLRGKEGGTITFGGIMPFLHIHRQMVYARLDRKNSYFDKDESDTTLFEITMRGVHLRDFTGGTSVENTGRNGGDNVEKAYFEKETAVVFDTLRRRSILAPAIYDALLAKLNEFGSFSATDPVDPDVIDRLPTILFQFVQVQGANDVSKKQVATAAYLGETTHGGDAVVAMPPAHYMEYDRGTQKYKFVMQRGTKDDLSVLGTNFMAGHDIYFDFSEKRIGFAETHCDYKELVAPYQPNQDHPHWDPRIQDKGGMSGFGKFVIVVLVFGLLGCGFMHYRKVRRRRAQGVQNVLDSIKVDDLGFKDNTGGAGDDNIQMVRESPQNSIERAIAEQQVEKRRQEMEEARKAQGEAGQPGMKFALDERDLEDVPDHGWRKGGKSSGGDGTGEIL
jgi:hypothetical protein